MLRIYVFLFSLIVTASLALADPPTPMWTHRYGGSGQDRAFALCNARDGGVFVTGLGQNQGNPSVTPFTIRVDDEGDSLWSCWQPTQLQDSANFTGRAVATTPDGGLAIAGGYYTWSRPSFLTRLDALGNALWTQYYFSTGMDLRGLLVTPDSGYVMIGNWFDPGFHSPDAYVFKAGPTGNLLWTQVYGYAGEDSLLGILPLPDGGFTAAGSRQVDLMGSSQAWLVRMDANGDSLWMQGYGSSTYNSAQALDRGSDGGYILAGVSDSSSTAYEDHLYIVRTDSAGTALWERHYWLAGADHDCGANGVTLFEDGSFVVVGWTHPVASYWDYDAFVAKFDANGDTLWTATYGTANVGDRFKGVVLSPDGGFYAAGYWGTPQGTGDDFFVVRYPAESGVHGMVLDNTGGQVSGARIAVLGQSQFAISDANGNYAISLPAGTYNLTIGAPCIGRDTLRALTIPPNTSVAHDWNVFSPFQTLSRTSISMVVRNHMADSTQVTIRNIGQGALDVSVQAVATSPAGPWLSAHPLSGTLSLNDSLPVTVRIAPDTANNHGYDFVGYILVHSNSCPDTSVQVPVNVSVIPNAATSPVTLPARFDMAAYPNPFNPVTTLALALPQSTRLTLTLYDVTGRAVRTLCDGVMPAGIHSIMVDGSSLPSGLYFARLQTSRFTRTQKLMLLK